MKQRETITIYDIAKAAGVTPGTVSRTINNIGYVKGDTRLKIEKAIEELQFTPNHAARILKTKKTGLVLLAIPDTDNLFYIDMIKADYPLMSNLYSGGIMLKAAVIKLAAILWD